MEQWRPASNGAGKHHWFVCREIGGPPLPRMEYHETRRGRLIWFGSMETAQRVADRLNDGRLTTGR